MTNEDLNKNAPMSADVQRIDNAIVFPCNRRGVRRDDKCGVFNSDFQYIEDSGITRRNKRFNGIPSKEEIGKPKIDKREVFFGGYLIGHFGHFLLESLARLRTANDFDLPIVWASGQKLFDYQRSAFEVLGIDTKRFTILSKPTQFKRLYIQPAEYQVTTFFDPKHRDFLAKFVPSGELGPKTYIARNKFPSAISNTVNESDLVEELRKSGWAIVYPEELSIVEQLNVIANSECVAGIEGSAFHLAILCSEIKSRFIMLRRPDANPNYDTIAKSKQLMQFDLKGHFEDVKDDDLHGRNNLKIIDVNATVDAINDCYVNCH